jgi:hypothetical protein
MFKVTNRVRSGFDIKAVTCLHGPPAFDRDDDQVYGREGREKHQNLSNWRIERGRNVSGTDRRSRRRRADGAKLASNFQIKGEGRCVLDCRHAAHSSRRAGASPSMIDSRRIASPISWSFGLG